MVDILLALNGRQDLWYVAPLIVALSLVYAATRHERMGPILVHAVRVGMWVVGFVLIVFAVLLLATWPL